MVARRGTGPGLGSNWRGMRQSPLYLTFAMLCVALLVAVVLVGSILGFEFYYADRIYPGVTIWGVDVGGLRYSAYPSFQCIDLADHGREAHRLVRFHFGQSAYLLTNRCEVIVHRRKVELLLRWRFRNVANCRF